MLLERSFYLYSKCFSYMYGKVLLLTFKTDFICTSYNYVMVRSIHSFLHSQGMFTLPGISPKTANSPGSLTSIIMESVLLLIFLTLSYLSNILVLILTLIGLVLVSIEKMSETELKMITETFIKIIKNLVHNNN